MEAPCRHEFEQTAAIFTGTVAARTCRKCQRIEVMLTRTGVWTTIDEYLAWSVANRSAQV